MLYELCDANSIHEALAEDQVLLNAGNFIAALFGRLPLDSSRSCTDELQVSRQGASFKEHARLQIQGTSFKASCSVCAMVSSRCQIGR